MASTRELRRRIKSIANTSKITKAMQMVSATKMRKAQIQALSGRPYTHTITNALSTISSRINPEHHPLFKTNESKKCAVVVFTSDKGLCGSLNTNIFRSIISSNFDVCDSKPDELVYYTIGKKGRDFIVRTGRKLEADFENTERINFAEAVKVRRFLINSFLNNEIGSVYLLYPDFISTIRQEAKSLKILPISQFFLMGAGVSNGDKSTIEKSEVFLFEPNPDEVVEYALIHLLDTQIYQAFLETKASEHSARMIAMQNATDNAKDLVTDLSLTYNQARQDAITKELLEITSAASALE